MVNMAPAMASNGVSPAPAPTATASAAPAKPRYDWDAFKWNTHDPWGRPKGFFSSLGEFILRGPERHAIANGVAFVEPPVWVLKRALNDTGRVFHGAGQVSQQLGQHVPLGWVTGGLNGVGTGFKTLAQNDWWYRLPIQMGVAVGQANLLGTLNQGPHAWWQLWNAYDLHTVPGRLAATNLGASLFGNLPWQIARKNVDEAQMRQHYDALMKMAAGFKTLRQQVDTGQLDPASPTYTSRLKVLWKALQELDESLIPRYAAEKIWQPKPAAYALLKNHAPEAKEDLIRAAQLSGDTDFLDLVAKDFDLPTSVRVYQQQVADLLQKDIRVKTAHLNLDKVAGNPFTQAGAALNDTATPPGTLLNGAPQVADDVLPAPGFFQKLWSGLGAALTWFIRGWK